MKPTVGRQVHYYGDGTYWSRNIRLMAPKEEQELARFSGPFAATVVFVHEDGRVNLLICFPSPCIGSAEKTEIVERVKELDLAAGVTNGWVWPPRA